MIKQKFLIACVGGLVCCKGTPTEVEIDNSVAQAKKDWAVDITGQWTEARKRVGQQHWVVDVPCEGGVSVLKIMPASGGHKKLKVSLSSGPENWPTRSTTLIETLAVDGANQGQRLRLALEQEKALELDFVSEPLPRIVLADGETMRDYYALDAQPYERVYQPDAECSGDKLSFELVRNNGKALIGKWNERGVEGCKPVVEIANTTIKISDLSMPLVDYNRSKAGGWLTADHPSIGRFGIEIVLRDELTLRSGHLGLEPLDLVRSNCSNEQNKARKGKRKPVRKRKPSN